MTKKKIVAPLSRDQMAASIEKVRESYERFIARYVEPGAHDDPKAFTAHHAAGRSALNHLEQLLKMTETPDTSADAFDEMLQKAQAALAADGDAESDDDDGEPA